MAEPTGPVSPRESRAAAFLHSVALGLFAALIVARAYWPETVGGEADSLKDLGWVAGVGIAALLAIASAVLGGGCRLRASKADIAAYAFFGLVALSVGRGAEARLALNVGWEWVAVGVAYAAFRQLPRDASDARALAACLVATAVALSAYGFFQVAAIYPEAREAYRRDPAGALRAAGVADDPMTRRRFEDRLLGSREPIATFALTNSLAGVVVGPLVLAAGMVLGSLSTIRGRPGRHAAFVLAAIPIAVVASCFLLTKSRSGYLGLLAGLFVLGWLGRRSVSRKAGWGILGGMVLIALGLTAAGVATGQLDWQVLSEAPKSLTYRAEYWEGTWRLLRGEPGAFWAGLGPGNFGGAYMRHRLPAASEAIADPHNLVLEAWATAGVFAALALVAAIGLGLREALGPPSPGPSGGGGVEGTRVGLVYAGGIGGLVLAIVFRPDLGPFARSLNPFEGDLTRWVLLGSSWAAGAWLGAGLWGRRDLPAFAFGAAGLAVAVHLLAAGGLGFAPVALCLWGWLALGQDVREDRACSRSRFVGGRALAFGLLAAWAAAAGVFVGTSAPAWRAESFLDRAEAEVAEGREASTRGFRLGSGRAALDVFRRAGDHFQRAAQAYSRAAEADPRSPRPWVGRAFLELESWRALGEPVRADDLPWHRIRSALDRAVAPPRSPDSLAVETLRARFAEALLRKPGWPPFERSAIAADLLEALQKAFRLNPTDAALAANLSDVLEAAGRHEDARLRARDAVRLSRTTPHAERQLPEPHLSRMLKRLNPQRKATKSREGA